MPSGIYLSGLAAWLALLAVFCWFSLRVRRARRIAGRSVRIVDAGLCCWCVLVVLTVPEIWFALVYDATDAFSQTNVSRKWYDRHVRPNKAGYRNEREFPATRATGRVYIAFVGDSFTMGHGIRRVADRFSDRVATALESRFPGRTVVFNAAVPGIEIHGVSNGIVPDLISRGTPTDVLAYVFVPNDIEYFDDRTEKYYRDQQTHQPQFFLFRDTYFYNWLYYRFRNMRQSANVEYYDYLAESYQGQSWDEFKIMFGHVRRNCHQNHMELRVIMFPFLSSLGKDDPFAPAYEKLAAHCEECHVPCLDLRPTLLSHVQEGLTVSRFDAHPNERAHELAAQAILNDLSAHVEALLEQRLQPGG